MQTGWLCHTYKRSHKVNIKYIYIVIKIKYTTYVRGPGLAYWWEYSSSTSLSGVRFLDPLSYTDWVCWFSTVPVGFSLVCPVFTSYQKPTFEFVPLKFNLICARPLKIKIIIYYFKNVDESLFICPVPAQITSCYWWLRMINLF